MGSKEENINLFIVVLGGNAKNNNIELHDIRWVIGESIDETIPQLKEEWFGHQQGLHIDCYMVIKYVDGFEINISSSTQESIANKANTYRRNHQLWFVNLGGYNPSELFELHNYCLVAATSRDEAKLKARSRWKANIKNIHKDKISSIDKLDSIDNCLLIEGSKGFKIYLTPDPKGRNQCLKPDWYGYWKLNK